LHFPSPLAALAGAALGPLRGLRDTLAMPSTRQAWVSDGRAHIAAAGIDQPGSAELAARLEARLTMLGGVRAAAVNGVRGRVVVDFEPGTLTFAELIGAVEQFEADEGLRPADAATTPPAHPGELPPPVVPVLAIAADVAAAGVSAVGRAIRVPPIPVAIPWLISAAEPLLPGSPQRPPETSLTGLGVALARAATMGLAYGELGLLTDMAHRMSLLTETRAWQSTWAERERQLSTSPSRVDPIHRSPRPVRLPPGPMQRYLTAATTSAVLAAGLTLAFARSPARSFGFLVAGTPTAARVGRDAFAAELGRLLARRGVVALDPGALRRLDRVDEVILDSSALLTGRHTIDEVRVLDDDSNPAELYLRAHDLVDPDRPGHPRRSDGWAIRPTARARGPTTSSRNGGRRATKDPRRLTLTLHGAPVGLVTLTPELDPLADELVSAARRAGQVRLAGGTPELRRRLSLDASVPAGSDLVHAVQALQQAGHAVALVSSVDDSALAAADCGVGVIARDGTVPWGGDLICGPGLSSSCLLLDAIPTARQASTRVGRITLAGFAAAALLVFAGAAPGSGRRALGGGSAAALFSIAAGTWTARALAHRAEPPPTDGTPWHALEATTALERLHSRPEGLSPEEARRRLDMRGRLDGDPERAPGLAQATLEELDTPLTPPLSVAAGTSAITGAVVDAVLIGTVLVLNAVMGGVQRVAADRAMGRLVKASAVRVRVRRGGDGVEAPAEALVPGDIIDLEAGDAIPADCRLLHSTGLEVDESSLTGESLPVAKSPFPSAAKAVADRHSMLHEGTSVAAGRGTGVVVATGAETELGRTARAAPGAPRPGGVEARLQALTRTTVPICLGAGVALVGAGVLWRRPLNRSLSTGISLAVAAVPEGLPFVATVAQLSAAGRLSRRNALVRRPATIEALGRVDVLCFDKTGTLTEGRIRLRSVSDGRIDELAEALSPRLRPILAAALRATPTPTSDGPMAHPTDQAVVEGAARCGVPSGPDVWRPTDELPFEPGRGFHAVLGRSAAGSRVSVKGAPEVVLPRCAAWHRDGETLPVDETAQREVAAEVERLARRGYRVLAVAERPVSDDTELAEPGVTELCFLGLVALADPVRGSAAEAVSTLKMAGVDVVVITGDHPSTAEAIASELALLTGRGIMTGPEIDQLSDDALIARLPHIAVFARTSPANKVRIVDLLRRSGRVVAVTGDGANDAPAIRMADVGIALGRNGTNAAKEAADVVITDDRIETITDAIVEGRALWASVRDAIAVPLGGNLAEIALTLGTGLFTRSGSALNARQLLLVNLLTDILPALAIASQRPTRVSPESLLLEGPDFSLGSVLNREIALRAAMTTVASAAAWMLGRATGTRTHAGTVTLVALVGTQLGQTFTVGRHSPRVIAACLVSLAALAITVQTPGLSQFFGCRPLGPTGWMFGLCPAGTATLGAAAITHALRPATHAADGRNHREANGHVPTGTAQVAAARRTSVAAPAAAR